MLFKGSGRVKENFLLVYTYSYFENAYEMYEYEIYDELSKFNTADTDRLNDAVKHFRDTVARAIIAAVGKEFDDSLEQAEKYLDVLYGERYDDCNIYGFSPAIVYSIAVKMVMGEDYKFKFLDSADEPDNVEDLDFLDLISVMIGRAEKLESEAMHASFELLIEDGILEEYPEY